MKQRILRGQLNGMARGHIVRSAAVVALSGALAAAAAGCSAVTGIANSITHPSPAASSFSGPVVGSGQQVKVADGSYETVKLPADSPVYASMADIHMHATLSPGAPALSLQDFDSSQKFVADYMATQFLDSTMLETGDAGAKDWIANTAAKWLGPDAMQYITAHGAKNIALGTMGPMPAMIHDGKPREKAATLTITSSEPTALANGKPGVIYKVNFSVDYRVSDHAAAAFAGAKVTPTPLTAEQFIASKYAKDQLKDGKGENAFHDSGDATLTVGKVSSGGWELDGFEAHGTGDISDFAQNPS